MSVAASQNSIESSEFTNQIVKELLLGDSPENRYRHRVADISVPADCILAGATEVSTLRQWISQKFWN
jgi:hypothetical protein